MHGTEHGTEYGTWQGSNLQTSDWQALFEDHLRQLAEYVDRRVMELVESVGQIGEARLVVMVSLLIADELSESFASLEAGDPEAEEKLAQATESVAERIETIAAGLEAA